jgi:pyruvate/2-oxoacid:ferredoxin oxidoreductase alpha subunit
VVLLAFGISARLCYSAQQQLRSVGVKAGLFRPKTLFPFPGKRIAELAGKAKKFIVVELNHGQMAEDVERVTAGKCPVLRYNWFGGIIPSIKEIVDRVKQDMAGV